ncbi:hypothetical protein LIP_2410 [Limnochorda pilosa]|uniref:Uncharacterized protein n=1 Tax=Limnochorda pilosa TaxID=1555112 RepID=A0A0K2SMA8_LIMPI|nr:hypothetical protein LIP_2410 [Limnochorda pilosa]
MESLPQPARMPHGRPTWPWFTAGGRRSCPRPAGARKGAGGGLPPGRPPAVRTAPMEGPARAQISMRGPRAEWVSQEEPVRVPRTGSAQRRSTPGRGRWGARTVP